MSMGVADEQGGGGVVMSKGAWLQGVRAQRREQGHNDLGRGMAMRVRVQEGAQRWARALAGKHDGGRQQGWRRRWRGY